ncbi:hypothetical protein CEUSTIGMA_g7899.t1 [Chlamydomonas eustigma]|uniref:Uncharacterized protein n=1 Tax=Chlamydomonas eustigma TaxID=1157962 RepID=A0A250XCH5_9CHLO|nr:hypothetical protein CEUSTIGMA_g7899.t1 [Chlamydomonas eustigma]|eukprot:GAX80460.1 hypothetical protein CEUSTIGMA_g7899.t1 [Chlamydomonas eustigma]
MWRNMQSNGHVGEWFDPKTSPIPVIQCTHQVANSMTQTPTSFFSSELDGPPCVRPATGREAGAYASFIIQNYAHLPAVVFFLHGHESSWHQDRNTSDLLREFSTLRLQDKEGHDQYRGSNPITCPGTRKACQDEIKKPAVAVSRNIEGWDNEEGARLHGPDLTQQQNLHSSGVFVSLNNQVNRDWRDIWCLLKSCSSAKRQKQVEQAWKTYFQQHMRMMPLPGNLSQMCCAQFAVSRERVLTRPIQLYQDILRWCMDGVPGVRRQAGECRDASCSTADIVMEVLWAELLGQEAWDLAIDHALSDRYQAERPIPTSAMRDYRRNAFGQH